MAVPAVTPASSPTPSHLWIFQVEALFLHRNTRISEKVVYAIKRRACHKICIGETVRRLDARFREHLRSTRLPDSDLPVGRYFASPDTQLRTCWFQLHPYGLNVDFGFI